MSSLKSSKSIIHWLMEKRDKTDPSPLNTIDDWKDRFDDVASSLPDRFNYLDIAVVGGFVADRVAYAFLSGYQAAVRHIAPGISPDKIVAYCVTEEGGVNPKAIKSTIEKTGDVVDGNAVFLLNGGKKFVTCADRADLLLVAVTAGVCNDGRNKIKMVLIKKEATGLILTPLMELPFIPEIPHGGVVFKDVVINESQVLTGDGYTKYVKPFRTVEDIHVMGGVLGYLFRVAAITNWPNETVEKLLALIFALEALSTEDPLSPAVHLTLSGVLLQLNEFMIGLDPLWERVDANNKKLWERDKPLLKIAEKAREMRLARAWEEFGGGM